MAKAKAPQKPPRKQPAEPQPSEAVICIRTTPENGRHHVTLSILGVKDTAACELAEKMCKGTEDALGLNGRPARPASPPAPKRKGGPKP